ncbi:hypothetical protein KCU95_g4452, partial [Aureobasidium melanogenum]
MTTTADLPVEHIASTVPTAKSAHTLTLPNEVLTMIASECDPADLKNMRLASKLMHQVSTEPLSRKKFSRRRFIFTYQSMKALVDITAHPVFGRHLECLTFGNYRMRTPDLSDPKHNDYGVRNHLNEATHAAFIDGEDHIRMLIAALGNLQTCGNTNVVLGIYDDVHRGELRRRGYAFEASYQDFHARWVDPSGTLRAVVSAMEQSKYPLAALKLCLSQDSASLKHLVGTETSMIEKFLPHTPATHRIFADIQIDVWQRRGTYAKLKLLSHLTRLELTRHAIEQPLDGYSLMRFSERRYGVVWHAIQSSQLESIAIERSDVEFGELQQFLQSHSRSLRSLELHQISAEVYNTAPTLAFLRFLRYNLRLNYLSIDDLVVEDRFTGIEFASFGSEKVVCKGEREVVEGLDKLIEDFSQEAWYC